MSERNDLPGWLTLAEAAGLIGLSARTLKRYIAAGDLSAEKRPWGKRERWEIQGAELARWAEATGRPLAAAPAGGEGHDSAPAGAESVTMPAPDPEKLAAQAAERENLRAQVAGLEAALLAARERLADTREERDRWRDAHEVTLRMLSAGRAGPEEVETLQAAPASRRAGHDESTGREPEVRRSWWQRLIGR